MQAQVAIQINSLQHVGIPVTNIGVSETFYNRLGFQKVMHAPFDMDGKTGTCIMMQRGSIMLELYQVPEPRLAEIRQRRDGHIDHVAFDVDDIDLTFAALKEAQFHIVEEAPVYLSFWHKGCTYFNIVGPDGERLEFNQIL